MGNTKEQETWAVMVQEANNEEHPCDDHKAILWIEEEREDVETADAIADLAWRDLESLKEQLSIFASVAEVYHEQIVKLEAENKRLYEIISEKDRALIDRMNIRMQTVRS